MNKDHVVDQLKSWHQKLSSFFDQSFVKNQSLMKCGTGCDQCCRVERSVFAVEAELIKQYAAQSPLTKKAPNALGICAFLDNSICSIYEVRPSICRSHGLVIEQEDGLSFCELNFQQSLPPKSDWLSGKTSDTVLATLQIAYEKHVPGDARVELRQLWCELTKEPN